MADENPENKQLKPSSEESTTPEVVSTASVTDDTEVSLDDLDSLLEEVSPGVTEELGQIRDEGADIEGVELQPGELVDEAIENEEKPSFSEAFPRIYRLLKPFRIISKPFRKIKKPLSKLFYFLKNKLLLLKNWMIASFFRLLKFTKEELPGILKSWITATVGQIKSIIVTIMKFKKFTKFQKLLSFLLVIVLFLLGYSINMTMRGHWFPFANRPLVNSLSEVADASYSFKSENEMLEFIKVFPQPEHTILLRKIITNLKATRKHPRAMGAFEFYFNVDTQSTAVEVKDRELEFVDVVQRAVEDFNYSELKSIFGLRKMKLAIKDEVNLLLNSGRIRNIYIKTIILKP